MNEDAVACIKTAGKRRRLRRRRRAVVVFQSPAGANLFHVIAGWWRHTLYYTAHTHIHKPIHILYVRVRAYNI